MGLRQIIKGIDGSQQNIGYSAVVPDGLLFINFFGGDVGQGRNLAEGGLPASVIGEPVVGSMSQGVLCASHGSYIRTGVQQSAKMTVMGVFCPTSDSRAYAISNASATRPIGFSVYSEPSATAGVQNLRIQMGGKQTSDGANAVASAAVAGAINNNVPMAFAGTVDYSTLTETKVEIRHLKAGTKNNVTSSFTVAGSGLSSLLIGSDMDAVTYANTRVLAIAVWNRILTDDEITAQYAQIKSYYLGVHGLNV
ncbi:hypothetical protein [Klebsiella pneumoniae]|uniref:hypothetical protein n=1 Tax=Klebsiella pneumoniae TaxID=573 RepID=UPI0013D56181|nr:hypothetical protein [Klebsiella pneumoniae]